MEARSKRTLGSGGRTGSALILTVVLTSLLAIVGVLFVLLSRMDKLSASASSQDRQLGLAVDAVIAMISDQLAQDTPGVMRDGNSPQEYYDYPDPCNPWLACLEPETGAGGVYRWTQVSDLTPSAQTRADRFLRADVIQEHEPITHPNGPADADGDGVADANWFALDSVRSSKGRPLYAAVRIIDPGAMLNVNTAWDFNLADPCLCDGSHSMQIDLAYLARRGNNAGPGEKLAEWRGSSLSDWRSYLKDVIWRFGNPPNPYTPFDVSDELKLRYRYVLNLERVTSRIENLWTSAFGGGLEVPLTSGGQDLDNWARKVIYTVPTATSTAIDPNYDFRHIGTVYNMDRIIDPCGQPMVNVNDAEAALLYRALQKGGVSDVNVAAQLAVNIRDFVDSDSTPTAFQPAGSSATYYGLEPQPFIRQIGFKISAVNPETQANNEFMVELYNPFDVTIDLRNCLLSLRSQTGKADVPLPSTLGPGSSIWLSSKDKDPDRSNLVLALYGPPFSGGYPLIQRFDLSLIRNQDQDTFYLDRQVTQDTWFKWDVVKGKAQYYARADLRWNILYQTMDLVGEKPLEKTPARQADDPTTWDWVDSRAKGRNYNLPNPTSSQKGLVTIGEIGRLLRIGLEPNDQESMLGVQLAPQPAEETIRLDLRDPAVADVFQYLTAIAPERFGGSKTETRIKGRINVNTAPAFVIDRLPWLQWAQDQKKGKIGEAIVNYRNQHGAFKGIGDLIQVSELGCMQGFSGQEPNGPDLTPDDEFSDLEARDLLFSRISNLVTVRSDVFSAYILVRIGESGPQRRVLAILDRSSVKTADDRVRVIVLQTVPDPR